MFLLCTSINHSWAYTSCWFRSTGLQFFFFSYLAFTLPVSGCWQRASWMGLGVLFYDSLGWASSAHVKHTPITTSFLRLSHRNHPADLGFLPSPLSPKRPVGALPSPHWPRNLKVPHTQWCDGLIHLTPTPSRPSPAPCPQYSELEAWQQQQSNLYISKLISRNWRTEEQLRFGFFSWLTR